MGIKGKFEVEFDINCQCDILHDLFSCKPHNLCEMTPANIHGCELHEGEFGKAGSIINWNYTLDGEQHVAKELIEEIDDEKKLVRFKVIEGDLLNEFTSLISTVQITPKEELSGVKWTVEFEKMNDDVHYTTKVIDFLIKGTKDIEAHHQKATI